MDAVLNGNGRAQFDERFARELAAVLDIDPSMIQVDGVVEGSVIVNFRRCESICGQEI